MAGPAGIPLSSRQSQVTELTGPTSQPERIQSIDILRGVAILGILVMNIEVFSMIGVASVNPRAYGDLTGLNYMVWLLSHIFVDSKFFSIFAMLFGAGIVLMAERIETKGLNPAGVHYRRMLILLVFGLAHGWLLWSGDILYDYAMCGLLVFLFRKRGPRTLILLGFLSILVGSTINFLAQHSLPNWPTELLSRLTEWWDPGQERIAQELETFRGGWSAQNELRFPHARASEIGLFLLRTSWRAGGLMLAGMGLFKLGVFSAALSRRTYMKLVLVGLAMGLPLVIVGVWYREAADWAVEWSLFRGSAFNSWGSLPMALAWIGAVMLFCQSSGGPRLKRAFAATGQMALTNYLMQTVICTTLFYGHGFGLYGSVERTGQILIVFALSLAQLLWSPWWLARFRFGPFEWLWRSLTYFEIQPLRR